MTGAAPKDITAPDAARHGPRPGRRAPRPAPGLLSIVCPAYNEADGIGELVRRVAAVMGGTGIRHEIVLVNDGSTDGTLAAMADLADSRPELTVVNLTRNFGKELALTAGLRHAMGDAIVILDADLQDPPELIPAFVEKYTEGYDVVYGRRISREGETWLKTFSAGLFYRAMSGVGPVKLPKNVGDFRLISRRVNEALLSLPERHRFMKGLFAWVGYPAVAIDYDRHPRFAGKTKWRYSQLLGLSVEAVTSFTILPLRVVTIVGFALATVSFLYGGVFLLRTLIYGDSVAGFPTLFLTMLMLGGVELVALGVMGEYLGRVFDEVKGRPLYLVESVSWSEAGAERRSLAGQAENG